MKKIGRVVAYVVYLTGLLLIALLPANKYEWMWEMDPDIPAGAVEDASGNSALFALLILIAVVAVQFILLIKAEKNLDKTVSVILILFALIVWGVKFW